MSDSEIHSDPTDKRNKEEKVSSSQGSKTASPCDLNSNDNPGNVITQVQLRSRGGITRTNIVQSGRTGHGSTILEGDNSGLSGLSNEEWMTLQTLLNNQSYTPNEKMTGEWIIDTGASNHMTRNLNVMHDVHNIESCPVGLPNGQHALSTKEGSVVLENHQCSLCS
jgi:hypothetical protein